MRTTVLAAALTAALAAPALAAETPGPFAGQVSQGQTSTHVFNNNLSGQDCIQLAADYTVSLRYAPSSDVLTLQAAEYTAVGSNGSATLHFTKGVCARFPVKVTGTSVAGTATYVVTVTRQVLPPLS